MGLIPGILFICASSILSSVGAFPSETTPDHSHGVTMARIDSSCQFPSPWAGTWFQSNIGRVDINRTSMSSKGECVEQRTEKSIEKFLIHDRNQGCDICMVIQRPEGNAARGIMLHKNVIRYKESYCTDIHSEDSDIRTFEDLCNSITGDAPLLYMFRLDAEPEQCPFAGRFSFTYKQGNRECRDPVSNAESCVKNSELLWHYKSCPDMTEERKVKMVCYGSWRSGENQYLLSRISHHMATSEEETYRCLIYKQTSSRDGYLVAQSSDAACTALYGAQDGPQTMILTKEPDPEPGCDFPIWLAERKQWQDMASTLRYSFSSPDNTMRQYNNNASSQKELLLSSICVREEPIEEQQTGSFRAVTFITRGCSTGFMCLNWKRRSDQIVQLQQGRFASSKEDACSEDYISNQTEWTTLVASSPLAVKCPFPGQYLVPTPESSFSSKCGDTTQVTIGCHRNTIIQFRSHSESADCSADVEESKPMYFACHGNWMDDKIGYFVASETRNDTKHCFIYQQENGILRLSSIPNRCPTTLYKSDQYNVTNFNECSSSSARSSALSLFSILSMILFAWILVR